MRVWQQFFSRSIIYISFIILWFRVVFFYVFVEKLLFSRRGIIFVLNFQGPMLFHSSLTMSNNIKQRNSNVIDTFRKNFNQLYRIHMCVWRIRVICLGLVGFRGCHGNRARERECLDCGQGGEIKAIGRVRDAAQFVYVSIHMIGQLFIIIIIMTINLCSCYTKVESH